MAKAPATNIDFYVSVPITGSSTVVFQNAAQQTAYWNARRVGSSTGNLYVRHTRGSVKVRPDQIGVNYSSVTEISWRNTNYENREFFARVVDFEVVNNGTVEIFFEIDWFQTYMFDFDMWSSHIEREGLTEAEHALAVANPWRNDILELMTPEADLQVTRELEESYSIPGNVSPAGRIAGANMANLPLKFDAVVSGGGVPGTVLTWPAIRGQAGVDAFGNGDEHQPGPLGECTIVIALSKFNMRDSPYTRINSSSPGDANTGPFKFSDLTGPVMGATTGDPKFANLSWITPSTRAGALQEKNGLRPFYLIGIRMDGRVHISYDRSMGYGGASVWVNPKERLNRVMGILAEKNLTHMIAGGPWVVPNQILDSDPALTVTPYGPNYGTFVGATIVDAPNAPYNNFGHSKLSRGPYRRYRVQGPDGAEVELSRERFAAPGSPKMLFFSSFDGDPSITCMPMGYDGRDADVYSRLTFQSFPVLNYSLDDALVALGQMRTEASMNALRPSDALRTAGAGDDAYMQGKEDVAGFVGGLSEMVSPSNIKSAFGAMSNAVGWKTPEGTAGDIGANLGQSLDRMSQNMNYASDRATADLVREREDQQLLNYSRTGRRGDLPKGMLNNLKGTLVGSTHHPGNLGLSLLARMSRFNFNVFDVRLRSEYVELYAQYFTMYGYSSGRLGIPKVVQTMRGGDTVRFNALDGQLSTYCKTNGVKIAGVPVIARQYIEGVFDGGHRFIKGW